MWTKDVTCHISKWKDVAAIKPSGTEVIHNCACWGDLGWRKAGYWSWMVRCLSKEWVQWAQTLASSHIKKSTRSLTWDVWFSLINSIFFFYVLTPCSLLQKLLAPPLPHYGCSLELRGCLPDFSPQKVHRIKHNSQLLGFAFFFFSFDRSQPLGKYFKMASSASESLETMILADSSW